MALDSGLIHEFGHTCLSLPDLYGYGVRPENVLVEDESGELFAGGPLLPEIRDDRLPLSSANNVPCAVGYTPLMDFCHLWIHPTHAGQIDHFAGYRGERFWGVQGRLIPAFRNALQVYDIDDRPLGGAAVYVYHVSQTRAQAANSKYFANRPKFVGHTDRYGRYVFPRETDHQWDDADTDEVDGAIDVWNPFGRAKTDVAFTPNVWEVQGLLLIRIASGDRTEFAWLSLTDFNQAFFRGGKHSGVYPIRTGLEPADGNTPILRPEIPEAVSERNEKPIAVTDEELTVHCGEEFVLDGTRSSDPEGQPLHYRWIGPQWSTEAAFRTKAPDSPKILEYKLYVLDGVRASDAVKVRVDVVAREEAQ